MRNKNALILIHCILAVSFFILLLGTNKIIRAGALLIYLTALAFRYYIKKRIEAINIEKASIH